VRYGTVKDVHRLFQRVDDLEAKHCQVPILIALLLALSVNDKETLYTYIMKELLSPSFVCDDSNIVSLINNIDPSDIKRLIRQSLLSCKLQVPLVSQISYGSILVRLLPFVTEVGENVLQLVINDFLSKYSEPNIFTVTTLFNKLTPSLMQFYIEKLVKQT